MKYNFIIVLKVKWEKKVILKSWIRPHCFKMTNILYVQLPIKSNKWYLSSRLYDLEDNGRIVEKTILLLYLMKIRYNSGYIEVNTEQSS